MLECNRNIHKKITVLIRVVSLLLPILCAVLLTSQVVFAKTTYVINDGDRVLYHTTYETDPIDVLTEAGLELGADDTYTTQTGVGMPEITIQRLQTLQVTYGGTTQTVTTYGNTVEELLAELNIYPGENDIVSVALDAQTEDGMQIVIDRLITMEETYTVSVPWQTRYVLDTTLAAGAHRVQTEGKEGQVQNVDIVSYLNGTEVTRTNQICTVICEPVDQIIAVGSLDGIDPSLILGQQPPEQTAPEATTGNGELYIGEGLIITPDGQILTYKDTMQVVATAYHNSDPGCTIWTSTGTYCRVGAIAVDPKVIPYGTRMYIVTNDGKYIYGIAVAEDCGGSIKGNRVDLYFDTTDECWDFGIRDATVYFLG